MANLKIFTANNTAGTPGEAGYISVTKEILKPNRFADFMEADPAERADLLNSYSQMGSGGLNVFHETTVGGNEVINNGNCRIAVEIDARKLARRSKHTLSFPTIMPANVNYLQPYVDAVVALNTSNPAHARQFLFGVMLLTRCR